MNEIPKDPVYQPVLPEDDGLQITDFRKGDFEWWYFDVFDQAAGCFLKIVIHIGTDPLKTRIFLQLALSINTPDKSESLTLPLNMEDLIADTSQCNITVGNRIKIRTEPGSTEIYSIKTDIPEFKCDFRFEGAIEGWKPQGNKMVHQKGKKKSEFYWIIPQPRSIVSGVFFYRNKTYKMTRATGYHDHNYLKVDREYPLYLDSLVNKWYWGKCNAGKYTMIFTDVSCKNNRSQAVMIAEDNKIIHISYSLTDCSVKEYGYDENLHSEYPASIVIKSNDENFPLHAEFEFEKILDHKDLLEGVNPLLKFLIKKLIAKPVYHGIFSRVRLEIKNQLLEGYGNFESMVFRGK